MIASDRWIVERLVRDGPSRLDLTVFDGDRVKELLELGLISERRLRGGAKVIKATERGRTALRIDRASRKKT